VTTVPTFISPRDRLASSPSKRCVWFVLLSWILVVVAVIIFIFVGFPENVNWTTLALIGVNITIWGLPICLQLRQRQVDFFHPLFYAAIYFALPMIVVKGVFLVLGGDSVWLMLINNSSHFVKLALIYMALGWLAVLFGFYMPLSRTLGRRLPLPGLIGRERTMVLFPVSC
jgi:hypothetical protein